MAFKMAASYLLIPLFVSFIMRIQSSKWDGYPVYQIILKKNLTKQVAQFDTCQVVVCPQDPYYQRQNRNYDRYMCPEPNYQHDRDKKRSPCPSWSDVWFMTSGWRSSTAKDYDAKGLTKKIDFAKGPDPGPYCQKDKCTPNILTFINPDDSVAGIYGFGHWSQGGGLDPVGRINISFEAEKVEETLNQIQLHTPSGSE